MKKLWAGIKNILGNRIFITFVGVIALTVVIWFGGPLLSIGDYKPWDTEVSRLVTLLTLALIWAVTNFIHKVRTDKSNKEIMDKMVDPGDGKDDEATKEEIDFLRDRMHNALQILKNSKLPQGKNLYSLPWYIIIGPPGSGKTTALNNSGLNFPLKEQMGTDAIHGIGGTRNCDWWFTDRAILLDTAGRYTTQDSNSKADSSAWIGFLDLLKKNRSRRPINGVIVTVSMTDLITQTPTERNIYARAIKQRLQELHNRLAINFPIYLMFTKADLVSGFNEFFDDLSREEREQVWGLTFPIKQNESTGGVVADFNRRFLELIQRANERVYSLQNHERDPERRSAIYEFPKQLRALQDSMDVFIKEIFSPNKFEQSPLLRGVYIASATQEGTPIDRVIGKFAEGVGLAAKKPLAHSGQGKGYFLKRLFNEIIFAEQNLATANSKLEKRETFIRRGSVGFGVITLAICFAGWSFSYIGNQNLSKRIDTQVEHYESSTDGGLTEKTNLLTLNSGLLTLRNLPTGFSDGKNEIPTELTWGLYQGQDLGKQASQAYLRGVKNIFIPHVISVLEKQLITNMESSEYLYTSLKFYLMLQSPERMDKELFSQWIGQEWMRLLPGRVNDEIRSNLMEHLRVALDNPVVSKLDSRLIEQTRQELQSDPVAERAYARLKDDVLDRVPMGFRVTDVIKGRKKTALFTRRSGKSLSDEIPGFFTYEGYYLVFKSEAESLIKNLSDESWIYGQSYADQLKNESIDGLYAELEELYFAEYITHWRALINDIELDGFTTADEGEIVLRQLTSGRKPIKALADAFLKNLALTNAPESLVDANAKKLKGLTDKIPEGLKQTKLGRQQARLGRLIPKGTRSANIDKSGQVVEDEFSELLYFAQGDPESGEKPPSEDILPALEKLKNYLKSLVEQEGESNAYQAKLQRTKAIRKLKAFSKEFPRPFSQWVSRLADNTDSLTTSGTRKYLSAIWKNTVLKQCRSSIQGRYPIAKESTKSIKLKDFRRFFGYKGTIDTFFNEHLSPFVNKARATWTFRENIGVKNSTLRQFQRAEQIREMFFKEGTQSLNISFSLVPKYLDTQVKQFTLNIGGQVMTYRHGPRQQKLFVWPGNQELGARFVFTPHNGGSGKDNSIKGPWSWFQMYDSMIEKSSTNQDRVDLKFVSEGNEAILQLITESVDNPFESSTLERFACPKSL